MATKYWLAIAMILVSWVCLRNAVAARVINPGRGDASSNAINVCRSTAACCHTFNFELGPEFNMAVYGPINASTWSDQGIQLRLEEAGVFGLLNLSKTAGSTILGATDLASPTEGMALAAFSSYPATLLRRTHTIHWRLAKQNACIGKVRISRTLPFATRQSAVLTTGRYSVPGMANSTMLAAETQTFVWSSSDRQNWDEHEFAESQIDELKFYFYGAGYATIDSVEVCYAAPLGVDVCGVCGGNGNTCVVEGAACDTGMTGICAAGTVDSDLMCVPDRAGDMELCNGIDDNCNGLIDEGDWGLVFCGRNNTPCYNNASRCINGAPNAVCTPNPPQPEICDGIDNDCDGIIDNSASCSVTPSPSSTQSPSASASPSPSASTSASPSTTPTPSASSSTFPSASPTPSTDPSASPSSTPSASPVSATPTPSSTPLPRDGSAFIVPMASCVRQLGSLQTWQAVFGYVFMGRATDIFLPLGRGSNILTSSDRSRTDLEQVQPTRFKAGAAPTSVFSVIFSANEELQWFLQLNASNITQTTRQVAVANRFSPLCQDSGASSLMEPIQPRLDRCVTQVASSECTASFGYYNPNQQTVQLDIGAGRNEFLATNTIGPQIPDRRQPRIFWPGTIREAVSVKFDCSHTAWSLCWSVSTLGTAATACVDQSSVC